MKVVFLHGLGQTASCWDKTIEAMDLNAEIFCPELIDWCRDRGVGYTSLYEGFAKYCRQFTEPINLCGLSLGGILALQFAVENPGKVCSLALIGTQFVMPKGLLRFQNFLFRLMPGKAFQSTGFSKNDFIALCKSMMELDFQDSLQAVSCPVMAVCGEKDKANKAATVQLQERLPNAGISFIANAGHEVNVDAPLDLGKLLTAFWSGKA